MTNCNNSQNTVTLPNKNDIPTSDIETSNTNRKRLLCKYHSIRKHSKRHSTEDLI